MYSYRHVTYISTIFLSDFVPHTEIQPSTCYEKIEGSQNVLNIIHKNSYSVKQSIYSHGHIQGCTYTLSIEGGSSGHRD